MSENVFHILLPKYHMHFSYPLFCNLGPISMFTILSLIISDNIVSRFGTCPEQLGIQIRQGPQKKAKEINSFPLYIYTQEMLDTNICLEKT